MRYWIAISIGAMRSQFGVGGAIGAWLGGYLFDLTHNYVLAFSISLGCLIISIFVVWLSTRNIKIQREAKGVVA